MLALEKGYAC